MAVTRDQLAYELRISDGSTVPDTDPESASLDRSLGAAVAIVERVSADGTPEHVSDQAALMLAKHLHDSPLGQRALFPARNSGSLSILAPWRVHRAVALGGVAEGDPGIAEQIAELYALVELLEIRVSAHHPTLMTRYFGWSESGVVLTADLAAMFSAESNSGVLPAYAGEPADFAYIVYLVPESEGLASSVLVRGRQTRFVPSGTVDDTEGRPYLVARITRRAGTSGVGSSIELVYEEEA